MLLAYRNWDYLTMNNRHHARWFVIVCALAFRFSLAGLNPSLSDDLFRYMWDGRILSHGINPYSHIPSDSDLVWRPGRIL